MMRAVRALRRVQGELQGAAGWGAPAVLSVSRLCSSGSSGGGGSHSGGRHPDFALHEDFQKNLSSAGIFAPLKFMSTLFAASSKEEALVASHQQLLNHISGHHVLDELKHPLLDKYHFDPLEFVEGCKFAISNVLQSLYSRDLQHFLEGSIHQGQSKAVLESVCSPNALESFLDHVQGGYGGDDMFKVLGETLTDDISIDKVELYLEEDGDSNMGKKPQVQVLVNVSFVSEVEIEYSRLSEESIGSGTESHDSVSQRVSQWQLSGCISSGNEVGQNDKENGEYEWIINEVFSHGGPFYE